MRKIFIILFIYVFQFNITLANTTISFIDMDKVISTSKPGLSIIKQLNNINKKNSIKFENDGKKLKEKEAKLISQKNILSEKDFQSKVIKLKLEINDYKENRNKINNDFNKLKINNTKKFLKQINPILIKYSSDKSISIILQKKDLIMGKTTLDITDEIINIVDNNIDKFKIQ